MRWRGFGSLSAHEKRAWSEPPIPGMAPDGSAVRVLSCEWGPVRGLSRDWDPVRDLYCEWDLIRDPANGMRLSERGVGGST